MITQTISTKCQYSPAISTESERDLSNFGLNEAHQTVASHNTPILTCTP